MTLIQYGQQARPGVVTLYADSRHQPDVIHFLQNITTAPELQSLVDAIVHSSTVDQQHKLEMLLTVSEQELAQRAGLLYDVRTAGNMVQVGDLWVGETEVTQAQYEAVMRKTYPGEPEDKYRPSRYKGNPNRPVEKVAWRDVIHYCIALSEQDGLTPAFEVEWIKESGREFEKIHFVEGAEGYRLPEDEEWVRLAKSGQSYRYAGSNNLEEVGWVFSNSQGEPKSVGLKEPNPYGLYDMTGNVSEWCGNLRTKTTSRGGSWYSRPGLDEVLDLNSPPRVKSPIERSDTVGFRVVRNGIKR